MFLFKIGKYMIIDFFKKILGLPTDEEKLAAKNAAFAPYKIEPPVFNNKTGDLVDSVPKTRKPRKPKVVVETTKVPETKSVPDAKNPRKPKVVAENKKAAEPKIVPAAKKTRKPRSTKV